VNGLPVYWYVVGTAYTEAGYASERATTAVNISEQRIAARISVLIVISGLEPMLEITAGPSSPRGKPSSPHTSNSDHS
jgi:hypothetical protein